VQAHRPLYVDEPLACDATGCGDADQMRYYWHALDPLLAAAGVDLVCTGHRHVTQRHCAATKGRCVARAARDAKTGAAVYSSPGAPVYLTIGSAGAAADAPAPGPRGTGANFTEWSAARTAYARARIDGLQLTVEVVDARSGAVLDTAVILKPASPDPSLSPAGVVAADDTDGDAAAAAALAVVLVVVVVAAGGAVTWAARRRAWQGWNAPQTSEEI
jgi:hypothetical protein